MNHKATNVNAPERLHVLTVASFVRAFIAAIQMSATHLCIIVSRIHILASLSST